MQEEPEVIETELHPHHTAQVVRTGLLILTGVATATAFGLGTPPALNWLYSVVTRTEVHITAGIPTAVTASCILGFLVGSGLANLVMLWISLLVDKWKSMDSGDR